MATTTFEACKKRKRAPKIFTIRSFATPESPMDGPFRDNIRLFLQQCSEKEDYLVDSNPVWCTLLLSETNGVVSPLYTVEENVQQSSDPFCDLCRCVGWSHHFVSKRRYHLIIPEDDKWSRALNMDSIEFDTHLLHGVIHCNGFGHLLSINGTKDNFSNYLCGEELMNLWDCLCSCLRTQKISVHDVLMKRCMDLRLLHGVAYGCSWFGDWGYKIYHGSFGVTEHMYNRAIQILSSLELVKIIHDFSNTSRGKTIQQIINCYLNASEIKLVTISDLFRFMLAFALTPLIQRKTAMALAKISPKFSSKTIKRQKNPPGKNQIEYESFESFVANSKSRWKAQRLEFAAKAIVNILVDRARTNSGASVSRRELRDEARKHVGDTGLIDFLIKTIHKIAVEDRIVRRWINPLTKMLEFYLQDVKNTESNETRTESHTPSPEPGTDVYGDLLKLYKNVLLGYPDPHPVSLSTRAILNSKNFVKEWQFKGDEKDNSVRLICRITPNYDELVTELNRPLPQGELVVVPPGATAGEMISAVQCALRDTYCIMDKFVVTDLRMGKCEECRDRVRSGTGGCDVEVRVRGCGLDLGTELRYEGGAEIWRVDCWCGAKDDDGERMVACEICQVWQHTRCNTIDDDEAVPCVFLCRTCKAKVKHQYTGLDD